MRHRLSKQEQLASVREGIRVLSKKRGGPKWLLPAMRRYSHRLAAEVRAEEGA